MKNLILLGIAILGMATSTYAQSTTGAVKVNIILNPTQEITINNSEVDLEYKTQADYKNGVSVLKQGQLSTFSTGDYTIKVKAIDTEFTSSGRGHTIELSDLEIELINQGANPAGKINLSTGLQTLSNRRTAGENSYDIKYKAAGNSKYISKLINKSKTTYTTNIQYEILPL